MQLDGRVVRASLRFYVEKAIKVLRGMLIKKDDMGREDMSRRRFSFAALLPVSKSLC